MFRFAFSRLACRARLTKNNIQRIGSKLSWSRSYAANEINYNDKLKGLDVTKESCVPCSIRNEGGASFMQQFENPTCQRNEDGYKYAPILCHAIDIEGRRAIEAGVDSEDLQEGVHSAISCVLHYLDKRVQRIFTFEEKAQVATIETNGDREIGEIVTKAWDKVGRDGIIAIADEKTSNNKLEFCNGMKIWLKNEFFNYKRSQVFDIENPFILIHAGKISNMNIVKQAYEATGYSRPLLIVAGDVEMKWKEASAEGFTVEETCRGTKVCVVRLSFLYDKLSAQYGKKGAIMDDLAILTGGLVVTREFDLRYIPQVLGSCKMVRILNYGMLIVGGSGGQASIGNRCEELRSSLASDMSVDLELDLEERLEYLSRGVAVLKLVDVHKTKKISPAIDIMHDAFEQGIIPGAGVALLHSSKELDELLTFEDDESVGVQLFQNALKVPVYTIASAAGFDGSVVVKKLMEQDNPNFGYDPARDVAWRMTYYRDEIEGQ